MQSYAANLSIFKKFKLETLKTFIDMSLKENAKDVYETEFRPESRHYP